MMDYAITTHALCKQYGAFKALNNLTMHVPKGAIYGLVGKNGAGKTTLIRVLCGLQEPSAGGYSIYGVSSQSRQINDARRRMGAIVESPSIYMDMTATDNLKMQCRVLGLPSFEGIDELLKWVGLTHAGTKKAKHFSLGMRQRLGIAVALTGDPDLLVLDEPINGLDPQGIIEMRELIIKLNRQRQMTVIISSHILDELSRLATNYGFIDGGTLVKEISAEQLEAACRKCQRIEVTDTKVLSCVLDSMKLDYKVLSATQADIFAKPNITQLTAALTREHCEVLSISTHDETLESYYINLVGGGYHA